MYWSRMHVPTLREDPAGVEAVSHRLLLRAGYVRQLMAGHYSLLPLAIRVRARIIEIVRAEMNAIGAQELLLPAMHPREIWDRTGRSAVMGDEMFRLVDRKGAPLVLGVTHEEIFTLLAGELTSYRHLPQIWFQFQTKFRDEPRPKSGLLRVREFTMKDSYSFDIDSRGMDAAFELHRGAYERIFARLGIPALGVEASSGAMGGSGSVEFMCPSPAGEDDVVTCGTCGYAANREQATSFLQPVTGDDEPAATEEFDTPGVRTIEDLAARYGIAANRQIKTLVYVIDDALTLVLLRGDHKLVEQKLKDTLKAASVRPAEPGEIAGALGALPGSLGAVGVELPVVADHALRGRVNMVTGANRDGVHLTGVDVDRDIGRDTAPATWADLRAAEEGEPCPRCRNPLRIHPAIEVGHIFKLGTRYSAPLDARVLDSAGARVALHMGSYGIGVERALACAAETHADEKGLRWPVQIAPFHVDVVLAQPKDETVARTGEELRRALLDRGIDVVVDDRDERMGVKLRDAELTGIPYRAVVSRRALADGVVELTDRGSGETVRLPVDEAADHVTKRVDSARAGGGSR
ncbi:proline--tRNA ligase [Streptomyces sp. B6B3]|uniref:proline--tRNA ligase n=1 Tax=Streptomyces sp. B6B3 TaxID=3153570 RepID=UPI00325F1404